MYFLTESPPAFGHSLKSLHNPRRDESPPASPQFISRFSKSKIPARQYAPIAPVTFTRRSTFTPLLPSTIDYNVSTYANRNLHYHYYTNSNTAVNPKITLFRKNLFNPQDQLSPINTSCHRDLSRKSTLTLRLFTTTDLVCHHSPPLKGLQQSQSRLLC